MVIITKGHRFHYELECLTMMFFPGEKIRCTEENEPTENFIYTELQSEKIVVKVVYRGITYEKHDVVTTADADTEKERKMSVLLYLLLHDATGKTPPWGILTGIRPVKLFGNLMEKEEMSATKAEHYFKTNYLVSNEKAKLAKMTYLSERKILKNYTPKDFSLYISIPFCPSRCHYCSFVSHAIDRAQKLLPEYIDLLCKEIAFTGRIVKKLGLNLKTVYFGGGTPSVLEPKYIVRLTDAIAKHFNLSHLEEYTFEAGRPDTVTEEKLYTMKNAGITRISINPQTMNDAVLDVIGRKHTAKQVIEAYNLARKVGFDNINMDIIAGLFGDTLDSFKNTIEELIKLSPENITVHTLSIKRSSDYKEDERFGNHTYGMVAEMIDFSQSALLAAGYHPYYLYRQKNTFENQENTGFCRPGKEGYYNIYIMDEVHSIIALGAGAATKLRQPNGNLINRIFNYKFPYEYISRFDEVLRRKEQVELFYERNTGV